MRVAWGLLFLAVSCHALVVNGPVKGRLNDKLHSYIAKLNRDHSLSQKEKIQQVHAAEAVLDGLTRLENVSNSKKVSIQQMVKAKSDDIKDFIVTKYGAPSDNLSHMLDAALKASHFHDLEREPTAKPVTKQRALIAAEAINTLKSKLKLSKKVLDPHDYLHYQKNLREIDHDVHMLEQTESTQAQMDLAKAIKDRVGSVRLMANKIEKAEKAAHAASKSSKSAHPLPAQHNSKQHVRKPSVRKPHRKQSTAKPARNIATNQHDLEQDIVPTTAVASPTALTGTEQTVMQAKGILSHASIVLERARLVGSAKVDMQSNLEHMKTDVDMMATTSNVEAINDLYQALRMRNDKVLELEAQFNNVPEAKKPAVGPQTKSLISGDATIKSVQKLISDLEETALAKTQQGSTGLSSLRDSIELYEKASSAEERTKISSKMQKIVANLQKQSEDKSEVLEEEDEEEGSGDENSDANDAGQEEDQADASEAEPGVLEEEQGEEEGSEESDASEGGDQEVDDKDNGIETKSTDGELEEEDDQEEYEAALREVVDGEATKVAQTSAAEGDGKSLEEEVKDHKATPRSQAKSPSKSNTDTPHQTLKTTFLKLKTGKVESDEIEMEDQDTNGLSSSTPPRESADLEETGESVAVDATYRSLNSKATNLFARMTKDIHRADLPGSVKDDLMLNAKHIRRDLERIMVAEDGKERRDMTRAIELRLKHISESLH